MIALTLAEIAAVTQGEVHGDPDVVVDAPATLDSRAVEPGGLFVAIAGERVDGHDFAAAAADSGAAAVLGTRATSAPTVVVADATEALGRLARHVLGRLPGVTVLALTGSQGKTGTKDYLAAVLADAGPTVATQGNHNNELGVPLTVLRATTDTAYLVVEMGARHRGNIAYLCEIAPPRVAAVLNVGTAHIGEFGSREAIALTKGEIVEALPPDGTAVLYAGDPVTREMASRTRARVLTFGRSGAQGGDHGDVREEDAEVDEAARFSFRLTHGDDSAPVRLSMPGHHQVLNACAAAAMALAVGVPLDAVAASLTAARPDSRWRMEMTDRADGVTVVNDAYNANPDSMLAALETLKLMGEAGRRTVAVLGEMKELGERHGPEHRAVGRAAARTGVDVLVVVGTTASGISEGTREGPEWDGELVEAAGRDEALAWLRNNVLPGDVVLVKASRGVALEHVAEGLLDAPDSPDSTAATEGAATP
ncbi:UDP-N-acetylmuramoyl-tripeptide--D-alanyl-D-alanine ligase [Nocardioides bigeumensis]|uniref:UDP-N-acetylmuramoyl-tripeptide--D-alanyl-D-alanine ligase n=1 Tax=Nocardioides bigeumensis TaxID=433657 RepID=A0ABN2XW55_9ACTN